MPRIPTYESNVQPAGSVGAYMENTAGAAIGKAAQSLGESATKFLADKEDRDQRARIADLNNKFREWSTEQQLDIEKTKIAKGALPDATTNYPGVTGQYKADSDAKVNEFLGGVSERYRDLGRTTLEKTRGAYHEHFARYEAVQGDAYRKQTLIDTDRVNKQAIAAMGDAITPDLLLSVADGYREQAMVLNPHNPQGAEIVAAKARAEYMKDGIIALMGKNPVRAKEMLKDDRVKLAIGDAEVMKTLETMVDRERIPFEAQQFANSVAGLSYTMQLDSLGTIKDEEVRSAATKEVESRETIRHRKQTAEDYDFVTGIYKKVNDEGATITEAEVDRAFAGRSMEAREGAKRIIRAKETGARQDRLEASRVETERIGLAMLSGTVFDEKDILKNPALDFSHKEHLLSVRRAVEAEGQRDLLASYYDRIFRKKDASITGERIDNDTSLKYDSRLVIKSWLMLGQDVMKDPKARREAWWETYQDVRTGKIDETGIMSRMLEGRLHPSDAQPLMEFVGKAAQTPSVRKAEEDLEKKFADVFKSKEQKAAFASSYHDAIIEWYRNPANKTKMNLTYAEAMEIGQTIAKPTAERTLWGRITGNEEQTKTPAERGIGYYQAQAERMRSVPIQIAPGTMVKFPSVDWDAKANVFILGRHQGYEYAQDPDGNIKRRRVQ